MIAQEDTAHKFILEAFAQTGRSPTTEDIRRHFGLPGTGEAEALVQALERRGSIHRNPGDPAITYAYPFSNEPTLHRVRLAEGPEVYAMCAIDALGMPFMLRKDAIVESVCAQCSEGIQVEVKDAAVTRVNPPDIMVWYAAIADGCVPATDLCPDLNFFCSREHLDAWANGKKGQALSFEEALQRGRQVFGALLYRPKDCCT